MKCVILGFNPAVKTLVFDFFAVMTNCILFAAATTC